MSTFDGIVAEFPGIYIDRFRQNSSRPALAYFLSHVHTDHLVGLESCRSPFIYCSAATREILLKLERYPHRMNFAEGILESRKLTYRHLDKLLKPIPLETPTEVELEYNRSIRVTLFDANHCVGAVMFLIEGDGNAILYTGDIRSEVWWVNSLLRNPILLPYVACTDRSPLKRLDAVYLDTTFAIKEDLYQEFPSKASGLMELLRKVSLYPADTCFYFDAWTFGYEEVWQALSTFLGSQIHVDEYRYGVYKSLTQSKNVLIPEASRLIEAHIGNHLQKGCITLENSRIHSCEQGSGCNIWNKQFVRITPIISRHNGQDISEAGAGGGYGDLNLQHELELVDNITYSQIMELCHSELKDQARVRDDVCEMLCHVMEDPSQTIHLELADVTINAISRVQKKDGEGDRLPLRLAVQALAKRIERTKDSTIARTSASETTTAGHMQDQITFPFSRHSSYHELCMLISAFKPINIVPCTVDEKNWKPSQSMAYLFGHIYKTFPVFEHDQKMMRQYERRALQGWLDHGRQSQSPHQDMHTREPNSNSKGGSSTARSTFNRSHTSPVTRDDVKDSNAVAKCRKHAPQGEFWPPIAVDHYYPLPKERKRPMSFSEGSHGEHADRLRQIKQMRSHLDSALRDRNQQPDQGVDGKQTVRQMSKNKESLLTPKTLGTPSSNSSEEGEIDEVECEKDLRVALKQEAYDAALGLDGMHWTMMGLVCVNGHQKEEEL